MSERASERGGLPRQRQARRRGTPSPGPQQAGAAARPAWAWESWPAFPAAPVSRPRRWPAAWPRWRPACSFPRAAGPGRPPTWPSCRRATTAGSRRSSGGPGCAAGGSGPPIRSCGCAAWPVRRGDILGKLCDSASHLRFCASLMVSQLPASGASACLLGRASGPATGTWSTACCRWLVGRGRAGRGAGRLAGALAAVAGWDGAAGRQRPEPGFVPGPARAPAQSASHNTGRAQSRGGAARKGRWSRQKSRARCIAARLIPAGFEELDEAGIGVGRRRQVVGQQRGVDLGHFAGAAVVLDACGSGPGRRPAPAAGWPRRSGRHRLGPSSPKVRVAAPPDAEDRRTPGARWRACARPRPGARAARRRSVIVVRAARPCRPTGARRPGGQTGPAVRSDGMGCEFVIVVFPLPSVLC